MSAVLLNYFLTLLILGCTGFGILTFFRKGLKAKWKGAAFFIGVLACLGYVLVMNLIFKLTFDNQMFYNTRLYRLGLGALYLCLLALVRLFLMKWVFFNRYREESGYSFALGFGVAPACFLAIYSFFMLLVVGINGIFNGPCIVQGVDGHLSFADNTIISVFRPVTGHLSFAGLFALFAFFHLVFGWMILKITTERRKIAVTLLWSFMILILESAVVLPIRMMEALKLKHFHLPIIAVVAVAVAFLLVWRMPKEKPKQAYEKQFDI